LIVSGAAATEGMASVAAAVMMAMVRMTVMARLLLGMGKAIPLWFLKIDGRF
jgi:hypothetical protein